ncbi:MAG: hypothetical protein K5873_03070 [Treponema sp.]|nr:hypothetical protein [Treponema sp.]
MKTLAKKIFACSALMALSALAFSLETGGVISDDTKFENVERDGSLKLKQKNALNLWLRAPINEDGTSYFSTEGSFSADYLTSESDSDKKFKMTMDLNLLKLVLHRELESGDLLFSAGRFSNKDITGVIFTQNADGVKLDAKISRFAISAYAAYTGLLNAKNITILSAGLPSPDLSDKGKTLYVTADKYLAGALTFSLPHIIAGQTLSLEGFGTFSLESTTLNRIYASLALDGPIVNPVFYSLSTTMGFTKYDDADMKVSNLSKASIMVYPPFKSMSLSLNGLYASGKQGSMESFLGFTSGTAVNSTAEKEYSGLIKAGLSASIKPIKSLLVSAGGDLVFDAAEEINYAGIQCQAGINWQALSDLSLGVGFSQYVGKEDYDSSIGASKTQIKINAAIAF